MKDYRLIKDFDLDVQNNIFESNLKFIQLCLNEYTNCIVITHHSPSFKCISSEYIGDSTNYCYANNLDNLLIHKNLIGWIYGHLHSNFKQIDTKRFLYSNCYRTIDYNPQGFII